MTGVQTCALPICQVREDDIWKELDGHDLLKNVGLDDGTFLYTKQRATDAVSRLLETRTDPHGYTILFSI